MPAEQAVHISVVGASGILLNVPAGQDTQDALKLPSEQAEHTAAPTPEYAPHAQSVQSEAPGAAYFPPPHIVHTIDEAAALGLPYVPAPQRIHDEVNSELGKRVTF